MPMNETVLDFLRTRKSVPIQDLRDPGPSREEIETMIAIASRVPDHGRLTPWRFILYRGDARIEAGKRLAVLAEKRRGPLSDVARQKELERFSRAPLVIGVIHRPRPHPTIPDWEKFLSGAAAAMNLHLAATALGYGANWVTGWYSDDPEGREILGLAPEERVIGFIHVGTPAKPGPERDRPAIEELISEYR